MATVNVNRSLSDQFYRYKMPKLIAKVEGKGNGIKTVIVNMVDIAKSLNRPPMYPTKYFGCVLGAQVNCDVKNERYIVNGSHDSAKLQDLLDGFIQKYVLCNGCGNPETVINVLIKKQIITTSCKACGYSGTISSQDKLSTYIIKYPPTQKVVPVGPSLQPSKKGKRNKKDDKEGETNKKNGIENGGNSPQNESDENLDLNGEDDDWCEDTDPDAVAKRMEQLSTGAKGLMLNADLDKSPEERLQIFFEMINKKKKAFGENFDATIQKDILAEADRLDIRDKAVIALCEALFDQKMLSQIKQHRNLFLRFTADNSKAQKYLLRGMELTIKCFRTDLAPKASHILKAFYDYDIIEEKIILDWSSKVYKKTVGKEVAEEIHLKAQPFIKWLKEAEEEESEEDEEEENIEVVYDDRVIGTKIEEIKEKSPIKEVKRITDEDDLDIDAI